MNRYSATVVGLGRSETFDVYAENKVEAYAKIHHDAVHYFGTKIIMVHEVKLVDEPDKALDNLKNMFGIK